MAPGGRKADPRNISDKGFMRESIRKLILYLSEHGAPPHPPTSHLHPAATFTPPLHAPMSH